MESPLIQEVNTVIGYVAKIIELCGIMAIIVGGTTATFHYFRCRKSNLHQAYEDYRGRLAKSILLGLEFLVAGDIIGTVAIEPNFTNLGVLALIVLIRTFLSFSLVVEIEGHWPWQASKEKTKESHPSRE